MVTDGVSLEISCLLLSKLHVFWGPGVDAIQKVLLKDGLVLLEELNSNYLLRDQCLAHEQYRQVNEYYWSVVGLTLRFLGQLPSWSSV